ncbi:hypothetical protein [Shewanella sp. GXUN23E]|uniref:hypothetical protein n=1 Tax=Shewanella sp. GXUN23E TaxID=3422498 RepID=UPI003D7C42FF
MQSIAANSQPLNAGDRRVTTKAPIDHWERLNPAQQFAFYSLVKLGYELLFVRNAYSTECMAIARLNQQVATIDAQGEINFSPDIQLRPH